MIVVLIVLGPLLLGWGWGWVKLCSEGHHILGLIIGRMKGSFKSVWIDFLVQPARCYSGLMLK